MATDYLTCGQCLREFPLQRITLFIQHKKLDCDDESDLQNQNPELKCNYCPQGFMTAWALLVHAQLTHNLKIFLEKASKTLLNQVKFSPVSKGDHSKTPGRIVSSATTSDDNMCGTRDIQKMLNENLETSLSQENDKSDNQSSMVNDAQAVTGTSPQSVTGTSPHFVLETSPLSVTGAIQQSVTETSPLSVTATSPPQNKMGSNFIVTRNILNGTKEVGEKTESKDDKLSIEKNAPRNTVVHVNASPQISTSQTLSLFPVNQSNVSFLPKFSVVPLSVSSGQMKSSCIKVLPTMPTQTVTQTSTESTANSPINTLVTVFKQENSTAYPLASTDNPSSDKALDTSTILLPKNVTLTPPSGNIKTQLLNRPADIVESKNSVESSCAVTLLANKAAESQGNTINSPVARFEGSEHLSGGTDENDNNQGNDMEGIESRNQGSECCSRQGCGVTIIPGSHEDLQECCNAVVPKKRKRHFELKHMPFSWSSSRYARRKRSFSSNMSRSTSSQFIPKASTGTIYIDLEPDSLNAGERPVDGHGGTALKVTQSATSGVKILGTSSTSVKAAGESFNPSKPTSLILKPGAVFSIPFTYTIPSSKSLQSTVGLPVARGAVSLAETVQLAGSSSSLDRPKASSLEGNHTQGILSTWGTAAEGQILQIERGKKGPNTLSKPFQCDKCTMAFNQRIHLKKHMSKHTGIKPYKCGECNYSTVERSHLKVHIRIHTGEKPFKCTYCEYATAQNSTLKIHLKRHHGGRLFQCQTCSKQFTQEEQLKGHKLEHGTVAIPSAEQKDSVDGKQEALDTSINTSKPDQ